MSSLGKQWFLPLILFISFQTLLHPLFCPIDAFMSHKTSYYQNHKLCRGDCTRRGQQDRIPAALLRFAGSNRAVLSPVPGQDPSPLCAGGSEHCHAMPWTSKGLGVQGLDFQQEQRTREGLHPHLGAIRLNDELPTPEHTKCLWQSTELCSSVLWTRLMPFLVDCPSFNQLRHLSIESKWNK